MYLKKDIHGKFSNMPLDWEVLSPFFSIHNIEPNWLYCNWDFGYYDANWTGTGLGGWTGCAGKVWWDEYCLWLLRQFVRLKGMRQTLSLTEASVATNQEQKYQAVLRGWLISQTTGSADILLKLLLLGIFWNFLIGPPGFWFFHQLCVSRSSFSFRPKLEVQILEFRHSMRKLFFLLLGEFGPLN